MNRYMQQMDELQKYYVEQKKPDQKKRKYITYDIIYTKFKNSKN